MTAAGMCAEAENTLISSPQRLMIESSRPVLVEASLIADARVRGETLDDVERQVRALELRIGVDHDGNIDRIGNGAEIGLDTASGKAGNTLRGWRGCRRRRASGTPSPAPPHPPSRSRRRPRSQARRRFAAAMVVSTTAVALCGIEVSEFAGRAERCQPVHAGCNEIVAQLLQHFFVRIWPERSMGETR
jgi:hypothetical protein